MYLFILLVLIWLILLLVRNHTYLSKIPMPESNFIFGHIFYFMNSTEILEKITNLSIISGGIIRIYIPPGKPTIIISNPRIIQEITRSEKTLDKANGYSEFFQDWLGEGLLLSKVSSWKQNRKRIIPYFNRPTILMNFIKIFESKGNMLIENLEKELKNPNLDVSIILKSFSMDVLCESSMGLTNFDDNLKNNYFQSILNIGRITLNRMKSPFKRYDFLFYLSQEGQEYKENLKNINDTFDEIMTRREENNDGLRVDPPQTFLDFMIQLENIHSTKYIREEVATVLVGGHDTISTTISFLLYSLSRHPEIQENVFAEQMDIIGTLNTNREVTYTELHQMKYLDLVINETLRMYPPITIIGRKVSEDLEIDGKYVIPKNHSLSIFIYGCHHNPTYFPEPEKFIPERFLNEIVPGSFIPFSMGPRNCIGKKFALLEIKTCVSKIVRHFKILPPTPDYKIQLVPQMILIAKNGIRLSLEKRVG